MIKIVLITNIPSPYRVDLFDYMQKNLTDYEFHVIYTSRTEDNRMWNVDENKMKNSHVLESKVLKIRGKLDDRYIHLPGNIGAMLSKLNPDMVIGFEYNPAALQSFFWCKKNKKPFIHLTDGTLNSEKNIGKIQKLSRKLIIPRADASIASSSKAKEKLMAWGATEESIFESLLTVDITPYLKSEKKFGSNRILYVGSMIPRKGIDLLINALAYVETDYELRIVGNGSKEETEVLKKQAKDLGIDNHLIWCGFKTGEALIEEYCEAAVFVLPTREDCFGLVLLEALSSRTPIVSSKYADGAYDIVKDGENGFIVDPEDAKSMANALERILKDSCLQEQFAEKSISEINKFTFEAVSKGYVNAIEYVKKKQSDRSHR